MPFGQTKGEQMDDDAIAKKIINNHLPPVINQCTHARISEDAKRPTPLTASQSTKAKSIFQQHFKPFLLLL